MIGVGFSSGDGNTPVAELFDQLSSSDGLLVLQVFGPLTVILSLMGICAATLDLKLLLLVVSGVVMIGVGFSSGDGNTPVAELFDQLSSSDGLLVLQVFGPLTVILSLMGICAATLDLKLLLLVFSVLALVEFVALMVVAAPLVQVEAQMDGAVDELFLNVTPLHRADPYIQRELNKLQLSPCGPILKNYLSFPIKLRIGIISAFATITMAAIALCLALALEEYWTKPPVEVRVDDFNRVTYEPKPSLT
ncbi:hypothetical protein D4764_22G0005620 [Takifugu flavidus]|uniref:Uncharacterized protein n=1 Tax=Takifugu flavidus TaxID=433684 RepID=A0A5C6NCP4_9TELE|nr:hypothetical protein D4764_22G0005620 [Takifugu flavidus]